MHEPRDVPAWVRTLHTRHARGTQPPPIAGDALALPLPVLLARGSASSFEDVDVTEVTARPEMARRRSRLAVALYLMAVAAVMVTVTIAGIRMWRGAHKVPPPAPTAAIAIPDGRLELATDRRTVVRFDQTNAIRWTAAQTTPLDSIEIAGPLVLGRAGAALVGIDGETGATRLAWTLPAGERWAVPAPAVLGACMVTLAVHGDDAVARCLDLASGTLRWTAKIAGGRECAQAPRAVPGAYLVQCPGWTTVIDDRDGTATVEPDGIGLVLRDPAILLRGGAKPQLVPWEPQKRRFARTGTPLRGIDTASSAILRGGRLVARASSAGDKLAFVAGKTGVATAIVAPELQLADDTPLVADCGSGGAPRFQLLELAPRAGATFDPQAAQHRVLALLDTDTGRLAWTSKRVIPPRRLGAPATPICRHGHYFVPLELRDAMGSPSSALWIVDAESGGTTAAVAFDAESDASFADLAADQIDRDRIVGIGRAGVFQLRWHQPTPVDVPGVRDARTEVERDLGRLP
jgi:putative pyrroloquinoline-quinone binding quinoprotein